MKKVKGLVGSLFQLSQILTNITILGVSVKKVVEIWGVSLFSSFGTKLLLSEDLHVHYSRIIHFLDAHCLL